MILRITVTAEGEYFQGSSFVRVGEPLVKSFEPLKLCDEPFISAITGDTFEESEKHRIVLEERADAAKWISEALTRELIKQMRKNDTYNGYPIMKAG